MNTRRTATATVMLLLGVVQFTVPAQAQSARQLYSQAEAALKEGEATRAVALGTQARSRLGSTNPRIEGLLAQAYLAAGDAVNARIAMDKLLRLVPRPKQQSSSFAPYRALDGQIDGALQRAEKEHEEEGNKGNQQALNEASRIESRYESTRTAKANRQEQASASQQQALYQRVRASGDVDAMREFARTFPKSQHTAVLTKRAADIERERKRIADEPKVWAQAQRTNTVAAYEGYLRVYPDGRHVSAAREGIYQARAAVQFRRARQSRDLGEYEKYYNDFRRGADIETVKQALLEAYQRFGDQQYDEKNWAAAKVFYHNYLVVAPAGTTEIAKRMQYIERILGQRSRDSFVAIKEGNRWGANYASAERDSWSVYLGGRGRYYAGLPHSEIDEEERLEEGEDGKEVVVDRYGAPTWKKRYTRIDEPEVFDLVGVVGITQKLFYPLWLNVGVLGGYQETYDQIHVQSYRRQDGPGALYEYTPGVRYLQRDESAPSFAVGAEAGLSLYLGWLSVHYGASQIFGETRQYVGIGFGPALDR